MCVCVCVLFVKLKKIPKFIGRKSARNVMAMATGEAAPAEVAATELPEIVKTVQEAVRTSFSIFNFNVL